MLFRDIPINSEVQVYLFGRDESYTSTVKHVALGKKHNIHLIEPIGTDKVLGCEIEYASPDSGIYRFSTSRATVVTLQGIKYIAFIHEENVKRVNRRSSYRVSCCEPIEFHTAHKSLTHRGYFHDVSFEGCCFSTSDETVNYVIGDVVTITYRPTSGRLLRASGTIKNKREENKVIRYGVALSKDSQTIPWVSLVARYQQMELRARKGV